MWVDMSEQFSQFVKAFVSFPAAPPPTIWAPVVPAASAVWIKLRCTFCKQTKVRQASKRVVDDAKWEILKEKKVYFAVSVPSETDSVHRVKGTWTILWIKTDTLTCYNYWGTSLTSHPSAGTAALFPDQGTWTDSHSLLGSRILSLDCIWKHKHHQITFFSFIRQFANLNRTR